MSEVAGVVAHVLDVVHQVLLLLLPLLLIALVKGVVRVHFVFDVLTVISNAIIG